MGKQGDRMRAIRIRMIQAIEEIEGPLRRFHRCFMAMIDGNLPLDESDELDANLSEAQVSMLNTMRKTVAETLELADRLDRMEEQNASDGDDWWKRGPTEQNEE